MRLLGFERGLLVFFSACWVVVIADLAGALELAGRLRLSLYAFYSTAAALGWVSGNVYVHRRRGRTKPDRRPLLLVWYLGPLALVAILRLLAPEGEQVAAPLVPIYAFGVLTIFFFVPISFAPPERERL
ncbi:MAG TPA: hypothetical protein VHQ65_09145 [Thermoanaerobaculia bacterium]|nr:hypothetical protein [Thermoanaerobaculia bacterium]